MYSGVPTQLSELGEDGVFGQALRYRLGDAEVDDLRHRVRRSSWIVTRMLEGLMSRWITPL